jgi:WD40 repeat protein
MTTLLVDARTGRPIASLAHAAYADPADVRNSVAISLGGRYLARARGRSVEVWDVSPDRASSIELLGDVDGMDVAVGGGGRVAFSGGGPREIQIIDALSGRGLSRIETPCDMMKLGVSRTGAYIASTGECGVFVWDTATGEQVSRLESRMADAIAFSWDERHLIVSGNGLRVREVKDPSNVRYVRDDKQRIEYPTSHVAVSSSRDGALLAVATGAEVSIRRADTGEVVARVSHPLERQSGWLRIAFTATPRQLVTADSRLARVWDLSAGVREIARFDVSTADDAASFTMLSPDARSLARVRAFGYESGRYVTSRGSIRLVKWLPEDLISAICGRISPMLSESEWRLDFGTEARRAQCPSRPSPPETR